MSETRTVTLLGGKAVAELPGELFDTQSNIPLIHQVVVAQLAAARQGTHSTKTRSEVAGGGAKPWRQKGTGRARQGSRRAPQWTGGGVVHGPKPRAYNQRTPKKMIVAALRGALSDRARDGRIHVVASFVTGEVPSTKQALKALAPIEGFRVLVVLSRIEEVAWMSLRNVASVHVITVDQLNAYDVLLSDDVVFSNQALAEFTGLPVVEVAAEAEEEAPKAKPAQKSAAKKAAAAEEVAEPVAADEAAEPDAEEAVVGEDAVGEAAEPEVNPAAKKSAKKAEAEAPAQAPVDDEATSEEAK